jgi:hypothetical protein
VSYKTLLRVLAAILGLFLGLFSTAAVGQSQKSDDDDFIRKHQFDVVKISCERLDDYAITRVFQNPVYHLTVSVKEGYGQNPSWGNLVATRVGDELVPVPRPTRDGEGAELLAMIRPDLKLTNGDVAETLQRALDLIFPSFSSDSRWTEKFRHEANQWIFLRSRSFNASVGPEELVVTTDEEGTITAVRYVRSASTP